MSEKSLDKKVPEKIQRLVQERRKVFSLPAEKALDRILDAPHPAALVHSFPEEDLYLLVKDIGPEDALPLLSMASDRQREFIFDMEIWDRDRIDTRSTEQWVSLFYHADPASLTRWFMEHPTDLAEYFLFQNIEIRIREHDQDPSDFGDDFFSVDNTFFVRLLTAPGESKGIGEDKRSMLLQLLNRMADYDHLRYQKILLEIGSAVIPSEYEEEAYRMRNVRLAEKGFLPFEEAVSIYRPLTPGDFKAHAEKHVRLKPPEDAPVPVPLYLSGKLTTGSLFARALKQVHDPEKLEPIQIEFASLCNRIAVADSGTIKDRRALEAVVQKACGYLDIGLESITGEDRQADGVLSAALIIKHPLFQIFRVGYGFAVEMKRQAEAWRKSSWAESGGLPLTFWGEAWLGVVGGLLVKRPLYFDNYETGALYREFATLADVHKTEGMLHSLTAFDALLSGMEIRLPTFAAPVPLSYKNLVLTLWARHYLGIAEPFGPINLTDFKRFFDDLWIESDRPRRIRNTMKEIFLAWLSDRSGILKEDISTTLGPTLEALFLEIESEYGKVSKSDLDPRYVQLFLLTGKNP
ncbi:MAG: hypothetical protein JRJ60_21305 [Deltaproteobacteria bacterium]|nr:hypothetical protein [Deltaproteobacteria bacterium]